MREINAVLSYQSNSNDKTILIMYAETFLVLENLIKNGAKYLQAIPRKTAPDKCPYCGAPIKMIWDEKEEPTCISYECGLVVLKEYVEAKFSECNKII